MLSFAVAATAQGPARIATSVDALIATPVFFHGKRIVVRHPVVQAGELSQLDAAAKPVFVYWKDRPGSSSGEIRGEFWDLGRMEEGDARFANVDFRPVVEAANKGRWPARDQVFVILGATLVESTPPSVATVREIALSPERYDGQAVTLSGRFRGRNLYGDLPQGVAKSKWDFVLQSADGAVWITGLRPKGKGFDLDPGARVDTGRWLEVKGTVHREGPAVWVAGESVKTATAPAETPVEIAVPARQEPPPTVIFSAPLAGESDVPVATRVRIQFSRDMNGKSFTGHVRIAYAGATAATAAPPAFTLSYNDGNRALEISFKQPLARFQAVTVQLDEGITAIDGQALAPFVVSFTTGGELPEPFTG